MGGQRLSANLPVSWLTDPTIRGLSPVALSLHTMSIAWSMAHESDGRVDAGTITVVRPPKTSAATIEKALNELAVSGLWARRDDGFTIKNWAETQTTHAQMEANRERWRNSKRGRQNPTNEDRGTGSADSLAEAGSVPGGVHGGTPEELLYPVRTGRNGTGKDGTERDEEREDDYDDAFATDPGLAFEDDDLWVVDSVDGTRHHRVTGVVLDG